LLVAFVGFAGWALLHNWSDIAAALRQLSPWAVAMAFVPAFMASVVSVFVWRELLAEMGERLSLTTAAPIFYLSQLGKYLPGSAWSILMQIELSRAHNVPKRTNVTVGVLVIAVATTTGLGMAALLLPFANGIALRHYWWIFLILPLFLTALHPRVLGAALNLALRLTRREPLARTPSWTGLSRVAGLQALVWLCLGLLTWLLLIGSGASPGRALLVAVGGYALAHSMGQLALGLPAGAGVREAVLALVLSTVVSAATAVVIALLARAILTVVDLAMAGGQRLIVARARRLPGRAR
jgi:glycosyltransferase 2 family protein